MKARTILGLIACASACATFSAFGSRVDTMFGVGPYGTEINTNNCTVTANGAEVVGNKIVIDNDANSPLIVKDIKKYPNTYGIAAIRGSAVLIPSSTNDFETTTGAKAGFAVGIDDQGNTNFYGYTDSLYAADNWGWVKLSGAVPTSGESTAFAILLDYRTKQVSFYKLGDNIYAPISSGTLLSKAGTDPAVTQFQFSGIAAEDLAQGKMVNGVDAFGSGSIDMLFGDYEVAVAAYKVGNTDVKTNTLAGAIAAAGSADNVGCVNSDGSVTYTAANGLPAWQCAAMGIDQNETLTLKPADKKVAGKITLGVVKDLKDHITLQVEDGITVAFDVSNDNGATHSGAYPADAIQIPMDTGKYVIVPNITVGN